LLANSRFVSDRIKCRRPLILSGFPVMDTRVEVRSGGQLILSKSLEADVETMLEFVAISNDVNIKFERSRRTRAGERIAFRVTHTTLFSEEEVTGLRDGSQVGDCEP